MNFEQKVETLLEQVLKENKSLFLIRFSITSGNHIEVIIDGDTGVSIEDCMLVSRAIEHNLDREEQDFSLQVMSAGISEGLTHKRQYPKNKGRTLSITTHKDEKFEGMLEQVTEDQIRLTWKAREPKKVGKGKVTVEKQAEIPFEQIKKAKVKINFN